MNLFDIPSPLDSFTEFITAHLQELWFALIFVGASGAAIVVLVA